MADKFDKKTRSHIMSLIRYKWTSPEREVHNWLKGHQIRHKMHPKKAPGADILIQKSKKAVLLNGCFWHACTICYRAPKTNRAFWKRKILANLRRDSRTKRHLRRLGYKIVVIWEHELRKDFQKAMKKIL